MNQFAPPEAKVDVILPHNPYHAGVPKLTLFTLRGLIPRQLLPLGRPQAAGKKQGHSQNRE